MASGTVKRGTVLLWTNSSPSSSFSAQTIPLDLTDFDAVKVFVCQDTTHTGSGVMVEAPRGYDGRALVMYNARQYREFSWSDTGVSFNAGMNGAVGGNLSQSNTCAIPLKIYGIRY